MEYLVELAIPNIEEILVKYSKYKCTSKQCGTGKTVFNTYSFKNAKDVIDFQIEVKKGNLNGEVLSIVHDDRYIVQNVYYKNIDDESDKECYPTDQAYIMEDYTSSDTD